MEKDKGRERVRDGGRGVLENYFSVFTRCSRRVFRYLYGVLEGESHGYCTPKLGTMLTALTIHLFKPEKLLVAF